MVCAPGKARCKFYCFHSSTSSSNSIFLHILKVYIGKDGWKDDSRGIGGGRK